MFQITQGKHSVVRVVTERRGSWKYPDAFRQARYIPKLGRTGWRWVSVGRSFKFPMTDRIAQCGQVLPGESSQSTRSIGRR